MYRCLSYISILYLLIISVLLFSYSLYLNISLHSCFTNVYPMKSDLVKNKGCESRKMKFILNVRR